MLPRPLGLQHKGMFFWHGFVIAVPFYAAAQSSLAVDALLIRALLFFFVQEILLQQAKFLWNDVRDRTADTAAGINADRLQLASFSSPNAAMRHVIIRWGAALIFGAVLSPSFLIVLLAISFHQLLYEWVFKPMSGHHPIVYFVFLCFNLPLRVLGGFVCLFDLAGIIANPILGMTLLIFYLLSWSSLSNQALVEAHRYAGDPAFTEYAYLRPDRWLSISGFLKYWQNGDRRPLPQVRLPRPHSFFFYENGRRMAALALFPAVVIALLLGREVASDEIMSQVLWWTILGITAALTPVTLRDVGFGKMKPIWRKVLRLLIPLMFAAWIGTAVLTTFTASFAGAMGFLIIYVFFHFLLYVDAPPT